MRSRLSVGSLIFILLGLSAGCPGVVAPPTGDGADAGTGTDTGSGGGAGGELVDGNRNPAATSPRGKTSGEPNDTFDEPVVAVFDGDGIARLQGGVATVGDLDVYLLGPLAAGDRVVVDAYAFNSSLDITVAMFDAEERLVFNNDDREDSSGGSLDAFVDFIVRHDGERYHLVVSNSPFGSSRRLTGGYRVDIEVSTGFETPPPVAQTIVLNFAGGNIESPILGNITVAALDGGAISPLYEGQTETIKNRIVEVFEQNYGRFNVNVLTSDDPAPGPGVRFSTVHFGGFDQTMFGIAEDVDLYNLEYCDDAIIFAESFSPVVFSRAPSAVELGTAIGNVAAHEAGHLLGLNHTNDDLDLMDDQSPADAFLLDQEFMSAPLSEDIMPIGQQDGVLLLDEIVGPK